MADQLNPTRQHRKRRLAVAKSARGMGGVMAFYGTAPDRSIIPNDVSNGKFSVDTAGWTATLSALASIAGGNSGNCLRVTNSGAAAGYAYQQITCPAGTYTLKYYQKNGTGTGKVNVGATAGATQYYSVTQDNADWTLVTATIVITSANPFISLWVGDTTSGHTSLYDDIYLFLLGQGR